MKRKADPKQQPQPRNLVAKHSRSSGSGTHADKRKKTGRKAKHRRSNER